MTSDAAIHAHSAYTALGHAVVADSKHKLYVPLGQDQNSNMRLLHLGKHSFPYSYTALVDGGCVLQCNTGDVTLCVLIACALSHCYRTS